MLVHLLWTSQLSKVQGDANINVLDQSFSAVVLLTFLLDHLTFFAVGKGPVHLQDV